MKGSAHKVAAFDDSVLCRSGDYARTPPKRTKSSGKHGEQPRKRAPWWLGSPLSAAASSPAHSVARSNASRLGASQPPPLSRGRSRSQSAEAEAPRPAGTAPAAALAVGAGGRDAGGGGGSGGDAQRVASYLSAFQAAAGRAGAQGAQGMVRAIVAPAVLSPVQQQRQLAIAHSAALAAAATRSGKGAKLQELKLQQLITPLGDASNRSPPAAPGGVAVHFELSSVFRFPTMLLTLNCSWPSSCHSPATCLHVMACDTCTHHC